MKMGCSGNGAGNVQVYCFLTVFNQENLVDQIFIYDKIKCENWNKYKIMISIL